MNTIRTNDDPLSLRYEMGTALTDYEAAPSPATAFAVAAALGKTRLFGTDPGPDLDGRLPPAMATAVAEGLEAALPGWLQAVRKLDPGYDDRWRTQGDEDCIALLEARANVWGALIAVQEAAETRPEVAPVVRRVQAVADRFDLWLRAQEEELRAAFGVPLLSNWKALLAVPYRDQLPWWLDDTLETAADRVRQVAHAVMPSERVWRLVASGAPLPPLEVSVAAGGPPADVSSDARVLRWISPDGRWVARLNLPGVSNSVEEARPRVVHFCPADEVKTSEVLPPGTSLRLGTAVGKLDTQEPFRVSLSQLRHTGPELEVDGARWFLTNTPSELIEEPK